MVDLVAYIYSQVMGPIQATAIETTVQQTQIRTELLASRGDNIKGEQIIVGKICGSKRSEQDPTTLAWRKTNLDPH